MQLKRDTGFALQIIFCLNENKTETMDTVEISRQSGIPKAIVNRLCSRLIEKGIISGSYSEEGTRQYYIVKDSHSISLADIVIAIERQADLFSVFDKTSVMYRKCGNSLRIVNRRVETCLKELTIDKLYDASI